MVTCWNVHFSILLKYVYEYILHLIIDYYVISLLANYTFVLIEPITF
jgi:hypothetical protein